MIDFYTQQVKKHGYWWSGNYPSWEAASQECSSYADEHIAEQVKNVLLQTKDSLHSYERDGCIIPGEPTYAFELLGWIKGSAIGPNINLIDFGGSLGTTYHQLKRYLGEYNVRWNVVEQGHFVKIGKETFEDENIKFYNTMDECLEQTTPNCLISSGMIPYVENPYSLLDEAIDNDMEWILLDRLSMIDGDNDLLSIQVVPPEIYKAIYPCWFFGEDKMVRYIKEKGYNHLTSFDALGGRGFAPNISTSAYRGFIFKKRK